MRYLNDLQRYTFNLPYSVRLCIVVPCLVVFYIVYILVEPAIYSASVLVIPVALAAWLLKSRALMICMITTFVIMVIYFAVKNEDLGSSFPVTVSFILSVLSLIVECALINTLRNLLDLSDAARIQIDAVYQQEQQLNKIKDQFILNVNHELRTPLTAVYGYLELLLEHNGQLEANMQATFLKNAMYSCEELQLLVNNVLDTIQIGNEKDHLPLEELSVAEVVYSVVEHFDPRRQQEHDIQLHLPEHLFVRANGQYMRQVLRNLLSNAVKYAPVNTPIVVDASLHGHTVQTYHPSPEVCITVKDAGPGIPPESIPRLFGQFVRLERDLSGNVRGTGLGLYVSKQLVEAMGGRIWVDSTGITGEGSCFSFTLPCVTRPKTIPKAVDRSLSIVHFQSAVLRQPQEGNPV